jgi:hypothetical protein
MLFGLSDALRQEKPAASLRLLAGGLVALCASLAHPAGAQSTRFGSSDDPSEHIQPVWWAFDSHLDVFGGLSLIGSEVRGAAAFRSRLITRPVLAQLDGTVRAGYAGE